MIVPYSVSRLPARRLAWSSGVVRFPRAFLSFLSFLSFLALFAGYLWTTGFVPGNSDSAGLILESQAILHGNLTLRGWYLPPDSYITTEMPLDALLSLVWSGDQLLRIMPALLYAATVSGAASLASRRVVDPSRRWLAASACVAMLAFPVGIVFSLVMLAPIHVGTVVVSLVAWGAYDHFVRHPASRAALGLFVLVAALDILGDPVAELLIVAPVGIVSVCVLWRSRGRDPIAWTLIGAATLALLVAIGARQILIASGTHIASAAPAPAPPDRILQHLHWLWIGVCALFHVDVRAGLVADPRLLLAVLNGGLLLVGLAGLARLFRRSLVPLDLRDSLTSVLSWAIVCDVFAYVFSDFAQTVSSIRYLLPVLVYAGILCYSALALIIAHRYLFRVIITFLAASMLTFGVTIAHLPRGRIHEQPLITFLARHHLTTGLGTYWATNVTLLRSNRSIRLAPVHLADGRVRPYHWQASSDWFQPASVSAARFIVVDDREPLAPYERAAAGQFGTPNHTYHVDRYTILVWDHSIASPDSNLG